jgi:asparagine synthase (glutamine-hydrolysing)
MCGICALIAPGEPIPSEAIVRMTGAVRHRGPDDEGYFYAAFPESADAVCMGGHDTPREVLAAPYAWCPKGRLNSVPLARCHLQLGHRRLSILDVSAAGHQPMSTPDGGVWIVFNGEIYNYVELREELAGAGAAFQTSCDTEVLLAAYAKWGPDCLHRLDGMFAFILYDVRSRLVFAARDRFGVKPLYYWISPDRMIAFASEIKQFAALPGWRPRMNGQRAYDFLAWSILDHTDETLFEGVLQVRNGECVELALDALPQIEPAGRLPVRRWYEVRGTSFGGTREDAARAFGTLFRGAVRTHLRSDVPVGSCLSGGLDSSSIVCVMNDLLREDDAHAQQQTFSACSTDARIDERRYIEDVVRSRDLTAHYVYPDAGTLFEALDAIAWHQDEPFGSTSIFAQWRVFELAARAGVKVMLDGQGADEQLAGYEAFSAARFTGLARSLRLELLWSEIDATRAVQGHSAMWAFKHVMDGVLPGPARHLARRWAGKASAEPGWLEPRALRARPRDPFRESEGAARSVQELSVRQLMRTNLQMLLHWEDRDSMAHSIEARVPFLDHRLVEFVVGLPDELKLSQGLTKRVLRDAMKGVLPESVRMRTDKLGFVTPEERWVRSEAPETFKAAAREAISASDSIFTRHAETLVDDIVEGRAPFSHTLWRVISFGRWRERHQVALP